MFDIIECTNSFFFYCYFRLGRGATAW